MKPRTGKERKAILWLGWLLISLTLLLWLILIFTILFGPEDATFIAVGGLIFSSVLIVIGIYCVKHGITTSPSRLELGFEHAEHIEPSMRDRERKPRRLGDADKLCAHFLTLGIDAQKLHKHPLEEDGIWGVLNRERHGKLVQVGGKNIGYVIASKVMNEYGDKAYCLDYLVPLIDIRSHLCRAKLRTKTESFWSSKIVDIEWKGETLADTLNGDLSLKQHLLEELRLKKPDVPFNIKITPWSTYQCARIITVISRSAIVRDTGFPFPSKSTFDCLDRIAAHVIKTNELLKESAGDR